MSLFGGAGTVIGTVIGALIIAVLTTGLVMLNVEAFWQFIVVGTVVIVGNGHGGFQLADGQTVGVAAPVIVQFDAPIADKAAGSLTMPM